MIKILALIVFTLWCLGGSDLLAAVIGASITNPLVALTLLSVITFLWLLGNAVNRAVMRPRADKLHPLDPKRREET